MVEDVTARLQMDGWMAGWLAGEIAGVRCGAKVRCRVWTQARETTVPLPIVCVCPV